MYNEDPYTMPFDEDEEFDQLPENIGQPKQEDKPIFETLPDAMVQALDKTITSLVETGQVDKNRINQTQRPVIERILLAYLNNKHFILEAPTGIGKTMIAIIVMNTIRRYSNYKANGYVCTSSKALQDQLEADIQRFNLNKWAVLKGQANYFCAKNGKPFPQRECQKYSMVKAYEELECGSQCEYLQRRMAAIQSTCAGLSYPYWLTTMNFVFGSIGSFAPFQPRDVTIMDECHQLSSILQGMFTIEIRETYLIDLEKMQDYLLYLLPPEKVDLAKRANEIRKAILELSADLFNPSKSLAETLGTLEVFKLQLKDYCMLCETAIKRFDDAHPTSEMLELSKLRRLVERESNRWMTIQYFLDTTKGEEEWIVRKFSKFGAHNKLEIQTLKEESLFNKHVHAFTNFVLYMSATIGDIPTFAMNMGLQPDKYDYMYMQSNFDFSKSPIYKVKPSLSMAMKFKDKNMHELLSRMLYICEELHPNDNGIVHTVNFEISEKFKEFVTQNAKQPGRFLFYDDSKSKEQQLDLLKHMHAGIIVGPSLIEGLDLKDDLSRFCIIAKVPYPSLDEFNTKRMQLVPGWYEWKTLTSFLQAIGRSVRHRNDWAITYLMDSCFEFLFKKVTLQPYILKRIENFDISSKMHPPISDEELLDF